MNVRYFLWMSLLVSCYLLWYFYAFIYCMYILNIFLFFLLPISLCINILFRFWEKKYFCFFFALSVFNLFKEFGLFFIQKWMLHLLLYENFMSDWSSFENKSRNYFNIYLNLQIKTFSLFKFIFIHFFICLLFGNFIVLFLSLIFFKIQKIFIFLLFILIYTYFV